MGKSVPGFILGLIGGILATLNGLFAVLGTELLNALDSSIGIIDNLTLIMWHVTSWATLVGGVLAIIGASVALSRPKRGGILMLVAAALLALSFYFGFGVWKLILVLLAAIGALVALFSKTTKPEVIVKAEVA